MELISFLPFKSIKQIGESEFDLIGAGFSEFIVPQVPLELPIIGFFTAWKRHARESATQPFSISIKSSALNESKLIYDGAITFIEGELNSIFVPPGSRVVIPCQGLFRILVNFSDTSRDVWGFRVHLRGTDA